VLLALRALVTYVSVAKLPLFDRWLHIELVQISARRPVK
jgi:hypothetical protein